MTRSWVVTGDLRDKDDSVKVAIVYLITTDTTKELSKVVVDRDLVAVRHKGGMNRCIRVARDGDVTILCLFFLITILLQ